MNTEPGADRGPRAGSPHGVVVATGRSDTTIQRQGLASHGKFPFAVLKQSFRGVVAGV
jgi:hypothetical protein